MNVMRHLVVFTAAGLLTWWMLHFAPAPALAEGEPGSVRPPMRAQLQPSPEPLETAAAEPAAREPEATAPEPVEPAPAEPAPMEAAPSETEPVAEPVAAAELGSRTGSEEAERREAAREAGPQPIEDPRETTDELARNSELLALAEDELGGADVALGFATTLISEPEQQLQIAQAFGEEIVLVPKAALLEGSEALSFRMRPGASPRTEKLQGLPDLQRSRQHRDLFAYDLGRLPDELRALRRNVIRRDEVFLFAALIPASEWAIVIGRRREAVRAAGVLESDVERYVLRYIPQPRGGFDFLVEEIHLAGGERLRHPFSSQY